VITFESDPNWRKSGRVEAGWVIAYGKQNENDDDDEDD
jgi:hypothetical protein